MIPLDTTKSQIYARELLNNFGSDYMAIPRLAPLLQLLQEEAGIKPKIKSTVEIKVGNQWLKGNITEVNLKYVEVETSEDITKNHIVRQKEDLVDILGACYINDNGNFVFQIGSMDNIRLI